MARVTSKDSFIPLGDAALHILVSEDEIEAAARKLVDAGPRPDRRRSASHSDRS
jgi:2-oxoisovalerate dehydrogenase E1 component